MQAILGAVGPVGWGVLGAFGFVAFAANNTRNKRVFVKGAKQRKRIKCRELKTGRLYLFSPIAEVFPA